jgi:hypothetical protein
MQTIVIDDQAGTLPIRDVVRQATGDLIELRQATGELIGTIMLHRVPTEEEYAAAIAAAEADIDELRRRANSTEPCLTTEELFAKLLQLSKNESR